MTHPHPMADHPSSDTKPLAVTITTAAADSKPASRPRKLRKLTPTDKATTSPRRPLLPPPLPRPLSAPNEMAAALLHLRSADPLLSPLISTHSPPDFHRPVPPFHALTRSILYQQLAFKASADIYSRFISLCGGESAITPPTILSLTPAQLRQIGVSQRKSTYLHDLARKYNNGILSDQTIASLPDKSLFTMLSMVKGIGAWSVHMFMIFSLHRPDVLPVCDLGFRKGVQMLYGLKEVPRPSQMEGLCDKWRPYRSMGAWYMWRLVESKGPPLGDGSVGPGALPLVGYESEGVGDEQQQYMEQMQMLPHMG